MSAGAVLLVTTTVSLIPSNQVIMEPNNYGSLIRYTVLFGLTIKQAMRVVSSNANFPPLDAAFLFGEVYTDFVEFASIHAERFGITFILYLL